jgi:hypothetical protein
MDKCNANENHKAALDALLLLLPGVKAGKMFGYPAYYFGRKLFACVYGNGVGIKLPEATARSLLETLPHVEPFRPMGKPRMREWVQINRAASGDYRHDEEILQAAYAYAQRLHEESSK